MVRHNEQKAMVLVTQALRELGYDSHLGTARAYLGFALNSIQEVAKKRERQERTLREEQERLKKQKILQEKRREAIQRELELEKKLTKKSE